MEILELYFKILTDSSVPANRVVRKSAAIALVTICYLIYYRHFVLAFSGGKPLLTTICLAFLALIVFGIFGGILAGSFYESFLKSVGALKQEPSIQTFFAEWLFAITAPILGLILFANLGSEINRF